MNTPKIAKGNRAQTFIDYAALIAVICFSLIIMSGYAQKSVNARFAHVWSDMYHPLTGVR
jgi:hypothetical protein